jgi:hypothetical protein
VDLGLVVAHGRTSFLGGSRLIGRIKYSGHTRRSMSVRGRVVVVAVVDLVDFRLWILPVVSSRMRSIRMGFNAVLRFITFRTRSGPPLHLSTSSDPGRHIARG